MCIMGIVIRLGSSHSVSAAHRADSGIRIGIHQTRPSSEVTRPSHDSDELGLSCRNGFPPVSPVSLAV